MKKLSIALLLTAFTAGLFADDAIVMPAGVFRVRLTNTYAFYDEHYDDDGEAQDSTEIKTDLLGGAFEMGMTQGTYSGAAVGSCSCCLVGCRC